MRNIIAKLVIAVAITAIAMFGADNSIGTWKRDIAKSGSTPPSTNPVRSGTLVYEAVDGGVKVTSTGQRKDGKATTYSYTAKYDGKEYPVTGTGWDTISIKQIDANHFTFEQKKTGGKYHFTGRTIISEDGKIMTITSKGTGADGTPVSGTAIYEKQ